MAPEYRERDRGDRGDKDKGGEKQKKNFTRKKACKFCTDKEMVVDFKDDKLLNMFLTERSKIVPRRISGNCAFHQRSLTNAIKRARVMALVGFTAGGEL